MATNVKARVFMKARVAVVTATTGAKAHYKEGAQWHNMHHCVTVTSLSEWEWRWQAAKEILCEGATDYTSYGDAIGDGWV